MPEHLNPEEGVPAAKASEALDAIGAVIAAERAARRSRRRHWFGLAWRLGLMILVVYLGITGDLQRAAASLFR
jgi:hypothetical protein